MVPTVWPIAPPRAVDKSQTATQRPEPPPKHAPEEQSHEGRATWYWAMVVIPLRESSADLSLAHFETSAQACSRADRASNRSRPESLSVQHVPHLGHLNLNRISVQHQVAQEYLR